jgi:2,3-bisphosphoglycerate-independent phosphoglycerate mutase
MSAVEVTDRFVEEIDRGDYGFAVVNLANPDMVGHTGSIPATVKAVETVDSCLARIVDAVERREGISLVTADHGNAEQMLEADARSPHTAHTTNPVPLVVTDTGVTLTGPGELSDLAPTVLGFMGFTHPLQMTGRSLTIPG